MSCYAVKKKLLCRVLFPTRCMGGEGGDAMDSTITLYSLDRTTFLDYYYYCYCCFLLKNYRSQWSEGKGRNCLPIFPRETTVQVLRHAAAVDAYVLHKHITGGCGPPSASERSPRRSMPLCSMTT